MLLTEENLPAAIAVISPLGFTLETIRPMTVLLVRVSGDTDAIEAFNALEGAGYDVSWLVTEP